MSILWDQPELFHFFPTSRYVSHEDKLALDKICQSGDKLSRCLEYLKGMEQEDKPLMERFAVFYHMYNQIGFMREVLVDKYVKTLTQEFRIQNAWYIYAINAINNFTDPYHTVVKGEIVKIDSLDATSLSKSDDVYKVGWMISDTLNKIKSFFDFLGDLNTHCQLLTKLFKEVYNGFAKHVIDLTKLNEIQLNEMEKIFMFHLFSWIWYKAIYIVTIKYFPGVSASVDDEGVLYWYNLALQFLDSVDTCLFDLHSSYTTLNALYEKEDIELSEISLSYSKFEIAAKNFLTKAENREFAKEPLTNALLVIEKGVEIGRDRDSCNEDDADRLLQRVQMLRQV